MPLRRIRVGNASDRPETAPSCSLMVRADTAHRESPIRSALLLFGGGTPIFKYRASRACKWSSALPDCGLSSCIRSVVVVGRQSPVVGSPVKQGDKDKVYRHERKTRGETRYGTPELKAETPKVKRLLGSWPSVFGRRLRDARDAMGGNRNHQGNQRRVHRARRRKRRTTQKRRNGQHDNPIF